MIHARHWSFGKEGKKDSDKDTPPEFLSTHPGYETRIQQLRSFLPEALSYYQPGAERVEALPAPELLDSAAGKAERELLKRVVAINRFTQEQNGERLLVDALRYELRTSPQVVFQERRQIFRLLSLSSSARCVLLGRGSINRIMDDYQGGRPWSEVASDMAAV